MKTKLIFAVLTAVLSVAVGTLLADPSKGNGKGKGKDKEQKEKGSKDKGHKDKPDHPKHPDHPSNYGSPRPHKHP